MANVMTECSYMLNWPGLNDFPIVVIDPDSLTIYSKPNPLPPDMSYLNSIEYKYINSLDLLAAFPSKQRQKARTTLFELVQNYSVKPLHNDRSTKQKYVHLATVLAFIMVYPYCPTFQKARSAVFSYLMSYPETQCMGCGFIQRDCMCSDPEWLAGVAKNNEGGIQGMDAVAPTQTVGAKNHYPLHFSASSGAIPPPPVLYLPTGQRADRVPLLDAGVSTPPVVICNTPTIIKPLVASNSGLGGSIVGSNVAVVNQEILRTSMPMPKASKSTAVVVLDNECDNSNLAQSSRDHDQDSNASKEESSARRRRKKRRKNREVPNPSQSNGSKIIETSEGNEAATSVNRVFEGDKETVDQQTSQKINTSKEHDKECHVEGKDQNLVKKGSEQIEKVSGGVTDLKKDKNGLKSVEDADHKNNEENTTDKQQGTLHQEKLDEPQIDTTILKKNKSTSDTEISASTLEKSNVSQCEATSMKEAISNNNKESSGKSYSPEQQSEESKISSLDSDEPESKPTDMDTCSMNHSDKENDADKDTPMEIEDSSLEADINVASKVIGKGTHIKANDESDMSDSSVSDSDETDSYSDNGDKQPATGPVTADKSASKLFVKPAMSSPPRTNISDDAANFSQQKKYSNLTVLGTDAMQSSSASSVFTLSHQGAVKIFNGSPYSMSPSAQANDAARSLLLMSKKFEHPEKTMGLFDFEPTGEKLYRCLLGGCDTSFETEQYSQLHEKMHVHATKKCYKCFKCEYANTTTKWFDIVRHFREHHPHEIKLNSEFCCHHCGQDMKTEEELTRHTSFHHYNRYRCTYCGVVFMSWKQVEKHLKAECEIKQLNEGKKYCNCPYCHLVFIYGQKVAKVHVKSHTDEGLKCCYCKDKKWDSWKDLKNHYLKLHLAHTGKGKAFHTCTICEKKFVTYIALVRHRAIEHGAKSGKGPKPKKAQVEAVATARPEDENTKEEVAEEPESEVDEETKKEKEEAEETLDPTVKPEVGLSGGGACSSSDESGVEEGENEKKKNSRKWLWDDEVESEDSDEEDGKKGDESENDDIKCKICEKSFRNSRMLRWHMDYEHSKRVKCRQCGFMAKSQAVMRSHKLQRHADITRHKCRLCEESFAHYHQYKAHKKQHKIGFPCQQCDKNFPCRASLGEHINMEHPPKPKGPMLKCAQDGCDYTCYSKSTMRSHIMRAHPELVDAEGDDHCYFTHDELCPTGTARPIRTLFAQSPKRLKHKRLHLGRKKGIKKTKRPVVPKTLPGARTSFRLAIKTAQKEAVTKEEMIREAPNEPLKRRGCARNRPYEEARKLKYRDPNYKDIHPTIVDKGLEMMGRLVPEVFDMQSALHGKRADTLGTTYRAQHLERPQLPATYASATLELNQIVMLDHNYMRPFDTPPAVPSMHSPPVAMQHLMNPMPSSSGRGRGRGHPPKADWGSDFMIVDTPDVGQFADVDSQRKALYKPALKSAYKKGVGEDYLATAYPSSVSAEVNRTISHEDEGIIGGGDEDEDEELQQMYAQHRNQRPAQSAVSGPYPPLRTLNSGHDSSTDDGKHAMDSSTDGTLNSTLDDMLSGIDDILKNVRSGNIGEEEVAALVDSNFVMDGSPAKQPAAQVQPVNQTILPTQSNLQINQSTVCDQQPGPRSVGSESVNDEIVVDNQAAEALLSLQQAAPFDLESLAIPEQQSNAVDTLIKRMQSEVPGSHQEYAASQSIPVTSVSTVESIVNTSAVETIEQQHENTDITEQYVGNINVPIEHQVQQADSSCDM